MKDFNHIHQILTENGYPETHESDWYICIEDHQENRIFPHYYDCHTKARAKTAVKSLLNKTDVYKVVVHHGRPENRYRQAISFIGNFDELSEHEWNYYFR